uniref:SCO family protein n=1 Tax=Eiseniibacteriota bacterium TaxID=2212470 RepID=A0A832I3U3_UNCEI
MSSPAPRTPRFLVAALAIAALGVALLLGGRMLLSHGPAVRGAAGVPVAGGDFVLAGAKGPWRLSREAAGRSLVLLYFGFVRCPDMCPATLARLASALRGLSPAERDKVLVLFVSVDHRSDTPLDAARLASRFGESFVGVSGDSAALERVVRRYDAAFAFTPLPGSAMGYTVDHSADVFLLRPSGEVLARVRLEGRKVDLGRLLRRFL